MKLDSVQRIRDHRAAIRAAFKNINYKDFEGAVYGEEKEYSYLDIINEIKSLLKDISTLTQHEARFIKFSTYNERIRIGTYLNEMHVNLGHDGNALIRNINELKPLLRSFNIHNLSEKQVEFEEEFDAVTELDTRLNEIVNNAENLKENLLTTGDEINKKFEEAKEQLTHLSDAIQNTEIFKNRLNEQNEFANGVITDLKSANEKVKEIVGEITNSLNLSKSNEKLITSFATKIASLNEKLEGLEQKTYVNDTLIKDYKKERGEILKEAKELIDSSKKALNYKSAEGLSASFQEQYNEAKKKWHFWVWIGGAIACILAALYMGNSAIDSIKRGFELSEDGGLKGLELLIISRFSLVSLPIIGAIFCANQYTKHKNIMEDYAYKMVISRAIVGFSEQLKKNQSENKNEEYVHYVKTALEQIHKDPLRNRKKARSNKDSVKGAFKLLKKISELD